MEIISSHLILTFLELFILIHLINCIYFPPLSLPYLIYNIFCSVFLIKRIVH